jgi:hypothetical protein
MYGSGYTFSKPFFTGWVTVGIIWIFCSFGAVGLFPIYEGRKTLIRTLRFMWLDVTGRWHPTTLQAEEVVVSGEKSASGDITPPEKDTPKQNTSG